MKILVTGATGFIGRHLIPSLISKNIRYVCAVRNQHPKISTEHVVVVGDINKSIDWTEILKGVDVIIHLAGCNSDSQNSSDEYQSVNVDGMLNLVQQASKNDVKRFVLLSSIKVYGEADFGRDRLTEESTIGLECDDYGISKLNAERELIAFADDAPIEYVIIRSPLVYGEGVKANFRGLMKLLHSGYYLPFSGLDNKRSMVAVDNLIDFIHLCVEHKSAANQVFLVSDDNDLSLITLVKLIRTSLIVSQRLFYFPAILLIFAATLVGKKVQIKKLLSSIELDISKAKSTLGWKPVIRVEDAIEKTVQDYLK